MMFYSIHSGLGRLDHVEAMGDRGKAQTVGFIDDCLQGLAVNRLADLDLVQSHFFLPSDHFPAFLGTFDRHRASSATAHGRGVTGLANGFSSGPDPWPTNFPQPNSVSLRHRPIVVARGLDVRTSRDAQMEVNLAGKVLVVAVAVNESR